MPQPCKAISRRQFAFRAYYRKKGHAFRITKKGQENSIKGKNCGFLPLIFPNLGHLEPYATLKRHMLLEFLVDNKAFNFSQS